MSDREVEIGAIAFLVGAAFGAAYMLVGTIRAYKERWGHWPWDQQ